jgi:hypothetical protein
METKILLNSCGYAMAVASKLSGTSLQVASALEACEPDARNSREHVDLESSASRCCNIGHMLADRVCKKAEIRAQLTFHNPYHSLLHPTVP